MRIPYLYETPTKSTTTPGLIQASILPLYVHKYFHDSTGSADSFLLFSLSKDIPLLLPKTRGSSSSAHFDHEIQLFCDYPPYPNLFFNFTAHADLCCIFSADTCSQEQTSTYLPCVQKICITGDTHTLLIHRIQFFTSLLFQGR